MKELYEEGIFNDEYSIQMQASLILFEAYSARNSRDAIRLAKEALNVFPDFIEAENLINHHETNKIRKLEKYHQTIKKAEKLLHDEGFFAKEYIGEFYSIEETKSYIESRKGYMQTLVDLGRYTDAINEGEELLKLSKKDQVGIRYILISIYLLLERYEDFEKIYKKCDAYSAQSLLPFSIMYYKKGNYKMCKKTLKQIKESNSYVLKYLTREIDFKKDDIIEFEFSYKYNIGSKCEAYCICKRLQFLIDTVPYYTDFIKMEK